MMFENVRGPIYSLAWSPKGDLLASAGFGEVGVWDMTSQELLTNLDSQTAFVWGVAWSPDGKRLAAATRKGLRIWGENLSAATELSSRMYLSVAWSPDGSRVAAGSQSGHVEIWDVKTASLFHQFEVNDPVLSLSWSPGGAVLAAGFYSGETRLYDLTKLEELETTVLNSERGGDVNGIKWSPDGSLLAAARQDGTVLVWDAQRNTIRHKLADARLWTRGLAWSPDGSYLASAGQDAKLRIWNAQRGTLEATYELGSRPLWSLAWSPDGQWIAAGNGSYNKGDDENTIFLVDPFQSEEEQSAGAQQPGETASPATQESSSPPEQPSSGPGGRAYLHSQVKMTRVQAETPGEVFLFEPAQPKPVTAPVVVFLQGVGPEYYREWIDHTVRRGSIGVYLNVPWRTTERTQSVLQGIQAAFAELEMSGHVQAQLDQIILVGHSIGAVMSLEAAAQMKMAELPVAQALLLIQPPAESLPADLSTIQPSTRLLVIVGEDDTTVGDQGALEIWRRLPQLPAENKDFIRVQSDRHGEPSLIADHGFPATGVRGKVDALDYFVTWKLLDALVDCVANNADCETALGGSAKQIDMGAWSDGVPVKKLQSTKSP